MSVINITGIMIEYSIIGKKNLNNYILKFTKNGKNNWYRLRYN
jgi:hypothetical protein